MSEEPLRHCCSQGALPGIDQHGSGPPGQLGVGVALGCSDKGLSVARPANIGWTLMDPLVMIWHKCESAIVFIPKKVLNDLNVWYLSSKGASQ